MVKTATTTTATMRMQRKMKTLMLLLLLLLLLLRMIRPMLSRKPCRKCVPPNVLILVRLPRRRPRRTKERRWRPRHQRSIWRVSWIRSPSRWKPMDRKWPRSGVPSGTVWRRGWTSTDRKLVRLGRQFWRECSKVSPKASRRLKKVISRYKTSR